MKFYKSYIIVIVSLLILSCKDETVCGTYISRAPTTMETISLMYSRGYYEFLYPDNNAVKLVIEKDSTFLYITKRKEHSGRWKVNGRILTLDYNDASIDDFDLKIRNNKLYNITEATLCKSKKKMMEIILLKKE